MHPGNERLEQPVAGPRIPARQQNKDGLYFGVPMSCQSWTDERSATLSGDEDFFLRQVAHHLAGRRLPDAEQPGHFVRGEIPVSHGQTAIANVGKQPFRHCLDMRQMNLNFLAQHDFLDDNKNRFRCLASSPNNLPSVPV